MPIPLPKKRGPPPGNTNALKHGFYARAFSPEEVLALDQDVAGWLKDEMELLLVVIADVAGSVLRQPGPEMSFQEHISALHTISMAIGRVVNLMHTRAVVFGNPDAREEELKAMFDRMEEMDTLDRQGKCAGEESGTSVEKKAPLPPFKRTRGGQPGNANAFKHGYYSRTFTPSEKKILQQEDLDTLRDEESLLRVLILRTWRSIRLAPPGSVHWPEYLMGLRGIAYASFVIEKLQRARQGLFGDRSELEKDFQSGLELTRAELGIQDFLHIGMKSGPPAKIKKPRAVKARGE